MAATASAIGAPASSAPTELNIELVNAPAMWSLGFTGQGVVVANLDSGVDVTHPDLAARWRGGSNSWFDPYGQHPTTPTDLSGHGTATMGVMVGGDAGGSSIGMAPGATWIAAKIFNDSGTATATAIHSALQWVLDPDGNPATADAPQVVNNSWAYGTPGCNLEFQPDLQALRAAEIVPVFAAGNYGPGSSTSVSPANYPEALAVGATSNADVVYSVSGRGPSACGEASSIYPEVVAPGVNIHTADLYGMYQTASGTSLAAPQVAGALALLLSAHQGLTASAQASALTGSGRDLGTAGPDNSYGYGRLDVLAAQDWLVANPPPIPAPTTSGVSLSPNASDASSAVTLSATVTSTGSTVSAAEYFVDAVGADSTGCAIAGTYDTASVGLSAAIPTSGAIAPCADLATLGSGNHVFYVHGKDATGAWGATSSATLVLSFDTTGPSVSGLSVAPSSVNDQAVVLSAAASDTATGGSNITAGEYFIDSAGVDGSGSALGVGAASPSTILSGTIPATAVAALAAGSHAVSVHARDAAGNWGAQVTATLLVDRAAPTFSGITLTPSSFLAGTAGVALAVTGASDPLVSGLASGVAGGEWWIGTTNITAGTGTAFSGQTTSVATASLAAGTYTIRVRIRDAAGNWSTGTAGVRTSDSHRHEPAPGCHLLERLRDGCRAVGLDQALNDEDGPPQRDGGGGSRRHPRPAGAGQRRQLRPAHLRDQRQPGDGAPTTLGSPSIPTATPAATRTSWPPPRPAARPCSACAIAGMVVRRRCRSRWARARRTPPGSSINNASNVHRGRLAVRHDPPALCERDPVPDPDRWRGVRGLGSPGLGHERRQRHPRVLRRLCVEALGLTPHHDRLLSRWTSS